MLQKDKKVLMLCTGGTIGMLPKDENDPSSPLVPAKWERIERHVPALKELSFHVETREMTLIDSSDMNPKYWVEIAKEIHRNYDQFDGFVILHGTDTMSYTATALSFLLENLGKPVIVTGSQLPLAAARNDAAQNLVTSLMIAASEGVPTIPEVCILFNNVLLRGNRSRKVSSTGFAGFNSPNFPPLAIIGEHIEVNEKIVRKAPSKGSYANDFLAEDVMMFNIFPGISPSMLRGVFSIDGLKGIVLCTYGTGNTPTDSNFLREIEFAVNEKNLAVVNITQCTQGMVEMGLYDASSGLLRLGVISGVDMTPEAALIKMMFLLGHGYNNIDIVKEQMQKDICGEQSYNVFNIIYRHGNTVDGFTRLDAQQFSGGFDPEQIATASIRFDGTKAKGNEEFLELAIFMNYPSADTKTSTDIPQCLGIIKKQYEEKKPIDCTLTCTAKARQVISDPKRPVQITVVSKNGDVEWGNVSFSIYTNVVNDK
ncbi:MAG: asparaginase [Planctomycetaceae bacterium]|nr:asparaginase [Planctomycetaceae bacterium]